MNEKDVKAEIKRLKTKISGDMYEDMENYATDIRTKANLESRNRKQTRT